MTIGLMLAITLKGAIDVIMMRIATPLLNGVFYPTLIFLILGIIMLSRLLSQFKFISYWAVALLSGVGTAVAVKGAILPMIIRQTIISPWSGPDMLTKINGFIAWIACISTLVYFMFSIRREALGGSIKIISDVGRIFMMLGFGVMFGAFLFSAGTLVTGFGFYLTKYPGYYVTVIAVILL